MSKHPIQLSPATRSYFLFGGMGMRCQTLREGQGLSVEQLARRDDEGLLRPRYIAELERSALGEPPEALNLAEAAAVAAALGVDVRELLFGDTVEKPKHDKGKPGKRKRVAKRKKRASKASKAKAA